MPMSTALINEITIALTNMKETTKADQSIANNLDELANIFKEYEEKWLMSRNTRINIYFYYAARNAALVVSRMKERLISSTETHTNPATIEELLQVVGLLKELLDMVKNEKPDEEVAKLAIEKVRQLRTIATNAKLVEAKEKELEDVDKLLTYLSKLRK